MKKTSMGGWEKDEKTLSKEITLSFATNGNYPVKLDGVIYIHSGDSLFFRSIKLTSM